MQEASTVASSLGTFLETIKGGLSDFNVTNLSTVLVAGISLAAAPAMAWFGYRFVKGKVTKALFKGKL